MSRYYDEEYIFGSEDEAGWFDDQERIRQEIEAKLKQEDEPERKRLVNEAYEAPDWSVSTPKLRAILDEQEHSRNIVAKQLAFVLSETPEPEPEPEEEEEEEVFKYHDSQLIINAEATNAAFMSNWPEMIQDNLKYYEDRNKKEIQLFVEQNPDVGRFTVECLRQSTFPLFHF